MIAMPMAAKSYKCSACVAYWPLEQPYRRCPECGMNCRTSAASAMSKTLAKSRAAYAEFGRRYQLREAKRLKRGAPTPEELGAQEAREIIELERALKDVA